MIAFVAAIGRELVEMEKRLQVTRRRSLGAATVVEGSAGSQSVLLVASGIGRRRAMQAAEAVLGEYDISVVVSLGYGGGLVAGLKVGDLVICPRVHLAAPQDTGETGPACCDVTLLSIAAEAAATVDIAFNEGDGATASKVADTEASRGEIAERTQAVVVDMEAYWVAMEASKRDVPFLAVRAISDAMGDRLPDLAKVVDADGKLKPISAVRHLSLRPDEAAGLIKFARNAARASKTLGRFGMAFAAAYAGASAGRGAPA